VSALEDFPQDMTLVQVRDRWILHFHAKDIQGRAYSSSRDFLLGLAEEYARMRRDQEAEATA